MVKNNLQNKLTKKEQSTTAAFKLKCEEIKNLKASLKKTQDEAEKSRTEKYETEKKNILLEEKLKNNNFIEIFKFLSSVGVGFSVNYFTNGSSELGYSIGVPSIVIFVICILVTRK